MASNLFKLGKTARGMRSAFKSKDVDKGYKALKKTVESIGQRASYARVGVFGGKAERAPGDPVDNVGLAIIHEYGAPSVGIPERSFLRSNLDANREKYATLTGKLIKGVLIHRFSVGQALGLLGVKAAADTQLRITSGQIEPTNTLDVFLAKQAKGDGAGFPRPLIDTGKLVQSITSDVVLKNSSVLMKAPKLPKL